MGNYHARCEAGEKAEITSKPYLSLSIGYADVDSSYWKSHFYAFGRLPIITNNTENKAN